MHLKTGLAYWALERPVLACLSLVAFLLSGSLVRAQQVHRFIDAGVMGTDLRIDVYGQDPVSLDRALEQAEAELRRIEDLMTTWRPSPLTRLNEQAGQGPQSVPAELAAIIARGRELHRVTGGVFDISFYPVGKLWDFKATSPSLPDPEELKAALRHVDASRILINAEAVTVELPAGMAIGLGGIAKGYGVDRAIRVLMDAGVRHALVNAGGDLKALGKRDGEPWEIAIKHPRDRARAMATLRLSNQCLVTSGDYERFFRLDGTLYHHILDPATGMPATGCISASVVAHNAELADALATACVVLGPEKAVTMLARFPRVEAILVGLDGSVVMTDGLPLAETP